MNKLLLLLLLCLSLSLQAQELSRRSFLGVRMENITTDLKRIMELEDTTGVLISEVIAGSTAEAAGFRKGDILLKIDNASINNVHDAVAYVGSRKSNTQFSYELLRERKKLKGKASFKPYPTERYPDLEMIYTEAKTDLGLQRLIVTRKKQAKNQPLVFFIGGIGCYSLDTPHDTTRSETQLLNGLARAGFTTVRLEKPGMGDAAGQSKACAEVGFHEEVKGYAQAIEALQKRNDLKSSSTYIIGHSMGGLMAPLVAGQTDITGIIAYGTIGSNFIEYLAKTRRTIGEAYNWPAEETDAFIKDYCECAVYYFAEKQTTAQVAAKKPDCKEYLSVFDLRSRKYNDELYAINIPAAWKVYDGKSLLAWGSSDYISAKEDHEIIANAVNQAHPGNAQFATVEHTDHGMNSAASFQEARTNPGNYNAEIGKLFLNWLRQQMI